MYGEAHQTTIANLITFRKILKSQKDTYPTQVLVYVYDLRVCVCALYTSVSINKFVCVCTIYTLYILLYKYMCICARICTRHAVFHPRLIARATATLVQYDPYVMYYLQYNNASYIQSLLPMMIHEL